MIGFRLHVDIYVVSCKLYFSAGLNVTVRFNPVCSPFSVEGKLLFQSLFVFVCFHSLYEAVSE